MNDALAAGAAHVGDWVGGAGTSLLSGNVAKRLRRRMAKGRGWPPLYECSVRGWCPKRRCEQPMKCHVLLPHEVVDKLCFFGDMNVIMGQSGFDAVTARHVRNASAQLGETPLGVGLWQDGVPCYWDRSISCEILSLFLPGLDREHRSFRCPLAALLNTHVGPNTFHDIFEVMRWSLALLARKEWPDRRHDGGEWLKSDSYRKQKSATQPRYPTSAILAQLKGDWKMWKEVMKLPGWNDSQGCCFMCFIKPDEASTW